ncbi:hypothetical protein T265_11360 [Opisthorchis viverrini]|uniref:Uncharacterized protein n=1 Tax=Opisthorchis viverrini TaxID=6198 RepID=A0A074YZ90_OPIVI|nr:hypothetical protein T265_11360 [Opisthorchis viverrini]KER19993.1 hypothetical protein T265_11360 [Opisthorchis viverrini]
MFRVSLELGARKTRQEFIFKPRGPRTGRTLVVAATVSFTDDLGEGVGSSALHARAGKLVHKSSTVSGLSSGGWKRGYALKAIASMHERR